MTLPSSGQISFNDIQIELGRSSGQSNFSINSAEAGTYGAINTASASKPDGSTPNAISEWYGYDHNASSCGLTFSAELLTSFFDCCGSLNSTYSSDCSTLANSCIVYNSSDCTAPTLNSSYFTDGSTIYLTNGSGVISSSQGCTC